MSIDSPHLSVCANCGITENNNINKLKTCTACKSVQYCGIKCQKEHRKIHKDFCKQRAAELRDEILFRQPEGTHYGDCPICCLPIPLDNVRGLQTCCGKYICAGCINANLDRELSEKIRPRCPFCRKPVPYDEAAANKYLLDRAAVNDPVALSQLGKQSHEAGKYDLAFEYCTKAAALNDILGHYNLALLYRFGHGVKKDEKLENFHHEEAAIRGHPNARFQLGMYEVKKKFRIDRAVKHWKIAAQLGDDNSIEALKNVYKRGHVSKEDLAVALRGHQAALDATKSEQREDAKGKILKKLK